MSTKEDHTVSLKVRLAQGVAQHRLWNKDHQELHDAARNGQKPSMIIYHNGAVDPAALLNLPPGTAFCVGAFPLILRDPDEIGDCASIYPFLAAASYATQNLGVEKHVMVITSNGPLSAYMRGEHQMGPLMAPWMDVWGSVVKEAEAFAAQVGMNDDVEEKNRIIALALLGRNAKILEEVVGKKVTRCYLDMESGVLEVHSHGDLAEMWRSSSEKRIGNLDLYKGPLQALACSCCDSRAGHGHLYCAQPGEFLDANVIAAIVPPYKDIVANKIPHPVWALTEHAHSLGVREAVVTGHSQCGGIKALVDWKASGQSPGKYLDAWVGQAAGVVDEVFDYARKEGFLTDDKGNISDKVYRLTEMRVTQWSARNLEEYFKDRANELGETYEDGKILAHYLKIEEREVYVLDLHAGIEETFKGMQSLETLQSSAQLLDAEGAPRLPNGQRQKAKRMIRGLA